ncbi:Uncharacterised protein [Sphingobacterium spiritivorum]|uniref:Uncharacterized protein n=1 Tax=Sphingobacterium spiritivorum TaxID=258 RepID=A0A380CRN8_SPHSI|nr:Uncharacterised protein [Sphingobacterium spiritivorum]
MSKIYTEEELKEIAHQLANPNGEFGLVIADNMNEKQYRHDTGNHQKYWVKR